MGRIKNGSKARQKIKRKFITGTSDKERSRSTTVRFTESFENQVLELMVKHNRESGNNITNVTSFLREILEQYVNNELIKNPEIEQE